MEQPKGLKLFQEQQRSEMRTRIDEAIRTMRADRSTITLSSLAEELGVSRRALYADYVQCFLKNYREFNPGVSEEPSLEVVTELKNMISSLNNRIKEADRKNKALKLEISVLKNRLQESEEQYAYLLGRYQEDVGNKIIHL